MAGLGLILLNGRSSEAALDMLNNTHLEAAVLDDLAALTEELGPLQAAQRLFGSPEGGVPA